jgi:cyclic pyranopterin phosphate synthase
MKLPHIRFCVNNICNFSCIYCKFGGESNKNTKYTLDKDGINFILNMLNDVGFRSIRFTGGEPLLRNDIIDILYYAKRLNFGDVELVTNGFYLKRFAEKIAKSDISLLTVSVDSAEKDVFSKITRTNVFKDVIKGIDFAHKLGIPLRFNMVVMKQNYKKIDKMMELASKYNAELKLLDLLSFQTKAKFWKENFILLDESEENLSKNSIKKEIVIPEGGYGVPMTKYIFKNGLKVLVKNSSKGAFYGDICNDCKYFPCQDGFYGLRITHDSKLKPCWPRDDLSIDIIKSVKNRDTESTKTAFNGIISIFKSSKFHKKEWKMPL